MYGMFYMWKKHVSTYCYYKEYHECHSLEFKKKTDTNCNVSTVDCTQFSSWFFFFTHYKWLMVNNWFDFEDKNFPFLPQKTTIFLSLSFPQFLLIMFCRLIQPLLVISVTRASLYLRNSLSTRSPTAQRRSPSTALTVGKPSIPSLR